MSTKHKNTGGHWFSKLNPAAKAKYLKEHPKSKLRASRGIKTVRPLHTLPKTPVSLKAWEKKRDSLSSVLSKANNAILRAERKLNDSLRTRTGSISLDYGLRTRDPKLAKKKAQITKARNDLIRAQTAARAASRKHKGHFGPTYRKAAGIK